LKRKKIQWQSYDKALLIRMLCLLFLYPFFAVGQTSSGCGWWEIIHGYDGTKSWKEYYRLSPAYFGPNALPVATVYGGHLEESSFGIAGDVYFGHGDNTQDIYVHWYQRFCDSRIGVKFDMVPVEHYKTTIEVRDDRASRDWDAEGWAIGDLTFDFYYQIVREKERMPGMVVSLYTKSASGSNFSGARYFDVPAYGIDLNFGKTYLYSNSVISSLNIAADIGFLCWQLAESTRYQNDALAYGIKLELESENWTLDTQLAGYSGYLHNGDSPLVWRCKLLYDFGKYSTYLQYQHGIKDYPFEQLRFGFLYQLSFGN
jgi:hypothetical protein